MTLNCIHIFIFTGSFLYWCVMRPASQRFFIHTCIYLWILIISYLATFHGTNSFSVLMCRKAVNQSMVMVTISFVQLLRKIWNHHKFAFVPVKAFACKYCLFSNAFQNNHYSPSEIEHEIHFKILVGKMFMSVCIRSLLMHGAETWAISGKIEEALKSTTTKCLDIWLGWYGRICFPVTK